MNQISKLYVVQWGLFSEAHTGYTLKRRTYTTALAANTLIEDLMRDIDCAIIKAEQIILDNNFRPSLQLALALDGDPLLIRERHYICSWIRQGSAWIPARNKEQAR